MQTTRISWLMLLGILLPCSHTETASAGETAGWNSFRNGGTSHSPGEYPVRWTPKAGLLWQQELAGYGQSTPVIHNGRVFVASVIGPMKETCCVSCWDLHSGTQEWSHKSAAATESPSNYMHSRAAPTPVVDDAGVFVFFEGGDLIALNHDGKQQWRRDLAADEGPFQNNHGLGSSPTQTSDLVILNLEHQGPSLLLAVSKSDGRTVWKTERPSGNSWTSPIVTTSHGQECVTVSSAGSVTAYQASSGEVLWTLDGLEGNSVPSPAIKQDLLVIGARMPEFGDASNAAKSNLCLQLTDNDYEVKWRAETVLSDYASPVVAQGCVYFVNKEGVLTCLDLASGRTHYRKRLQCECWSTPLVAGEHVYFFGKRGETHVVRAGPEFTTTAVNHLWDPDSPPLPETYTEAAGHERHGADAEGGRPRQSGGMLARLLVGDRNEDGVLTKDELPPPFQRMMARADLNEDGQLDQEELQAMQEEFQKRRAGAREGARDPIVYGVAAADGVIIVRTGTRLYAISGGTGRVESAASGEAKP